jgi:hypothetical protein
VILMNTISQCCKASVSPDLKREYPLGGNTWSQTFKIEVCDSCQKECETMEACEICGEVNCQGECEETFLCYKCEEAVALEEKFNKDHEICRECVGDLHKEFERCLSDASKSRDKNEHDSLLNESQSIKAHIQSITGGLPATDIGDYERLVIRP